MIELCEAVTEFKYRNCISVTNTFLRALMNAACGQVTVGAAVLVIFDSH